MGVGSPPDPAASDPIAALGPWFHNLHLPDGRQTFPNHPLGDFPSFKWRQVAPCLPDDLTGMTALDIGCNAGFYSFALASRGADVLGVDVDEHYLRQARWASRELELDVAFERRSVYDLGDLADTFDVVVFMGVLYHLRYPLLGLDLVARTARPGGTVVVQSLTMPGDEVDPPRDDAPLEDRDFLVRPGWPKMAFIEHKLAGDPTNWWAPNAACLEAMLRSAGLVVRERPGHEIYVCEPDPGRDPELDERVRSELAQVRPEVR